MRVALNKIQPLFSFFLYFYLIIVFNLFASGCAAKHNDDASLWATSAEYEAISRMVFNAAAERLNKIQQKYGAPKNAVIADIDETIITSIDFQKTLAETKQKFSEEAWDAWIKERKGRPMPGAVEFLQQAHKAGLRIYYVTNRKCAARLSPKVNANVNPKDFSDKDDCPQKADTIALLARYGFPQAEPENVLLRDEKEEWGEDKAARRNYIMQKYTVLMIFGDDLGDFIENARGLTLKERKDKIKLFKDRWGVSWFLLPNPMYGSWTTSNE